MNQNNYTLRIDVREFEAKNGREPTREEERQMIVDVIENNKDLTKEEREKALNGALIMHNSFWNGNYTEITNI